MKKKVYVLGNPHLTFDSLPLKLFPKLAKLCPQFNFVIFDPTENFEQGLEEELTLIDTVIGIDKVTIYHDLGYFSLSPRLSVHDYDLPLSLGVLEKLKKIKKITIIGVPSPGNFQKILQDVIDKLYSHLTFKK